MKKLINKCIVLIALICFIISCKEKRNPLQNESKNELIGTWHLTTKGQKIFDKGVIMYSADGQMTVLLSKKDSIVTGYSGKYEVNEQDKYVAHYRDYYSLLPNINDSTPPVWIRDYALSADRKTLTLSPREDRSFSLVWERVQK
jgi:hypothetical protein